MYHNLSTKISLGSYFSGILLCLEIEMNGCHLNGQSFGLQMFAGSFDFPMNYHRFGEFEMLEMSMCFLDVDVRDAPWWVLRMFDWVARWHSCCGLVCEDIYLRCCLNGCCSRKRGEVFLVPLQMAVLEAAI